MHTMARDAARLIHLSWVRGCRRAFAFTFSFSFTCSPENGDCRVREGDALRSNVVISALCCCSQNGNYSDNNNNNLIDYIAFAFVFAFALANAAVGGLNVSILCNYRYFILIAKIVDANSSLQLVLTA